MLQALVVVLLSLAVVVLSIFLLGLGSLLKGRCVLRRCGPEGPVGDACDGCPSGSATRVASANGGLSPAGFNRWGRLWSRPSGAAGQRPTSEGDPRRTSRRVLASGRW